MSNRETFQYEQGCHKAKNNDIEIAVDFRHSSWPVKYRFIGEKEWQASEFQTVDVQSLDAEQVLEKIDSWLDSMS